MHQYYKILGLPVGSSIEVVKKRYRKLVLQFHPDRNPSPEAKQKFLEITQAYDIITGKESIPQVKNPHTSASPHKAQPTQEERVKKARQRHKEQVYKEYVENEKYFQSLTRGWKWRLIKFNAVLGTTIALLLIAEQLLPRHFERDRIAQYEAIGNYYKSNEYKYIITANNVKLWSNGVNYQMAYKYPEIILERTWIFHNVKSFYSDQKVVYYKFPVYFSFGNLFPLLVCMFLIPVLTLWYKRRTILFTILHLISTNVVTLLLLYFLFTGDRWAHLLTLGFI